MSYESMVEEFIASMERIGKKSAHQQMQHSFKGERVLLFYICNHDGEATPSDLCQEMQLSSARIAAALNNLEKKLYIKREPDGKDRRKTRLYITESGKKQIEMHKQKMLSHFEMMFQKLGEHDSKEFLRIIKNIANMDWGEDESL